MFLGFQSFRIGRAVDPPLGGLLVTAPTGAPPPPPLAAFVVALVLDPGIRASAAVRSAALVAERLAARVGEIVSRRNQAVVSRDLDREAMTLLDLQQTFALLVQDVEADGGRHREHHVAAAALQAFFFQRPQDMQGG